MRRVALVVVLLLTLTGCSEQSVPHVVEYELNMVGPNAFADIQARYTGENGLSQRADQFAGSWSQRVTVKYPDVKSVRLTGTFKLRDSIPGQETRLPVSKLRCTITVDGEVADQRIQDAPTCTAKLSATAHPLPSGSGP
jgi:hypothetical protein